METATPCTIGLGSNTDDKEYQIKEAIEFLLGTLKNVLYLQFTSLKHSMGKTLLISMQWFTAIVHPAMKIL